MTCDSDFVGPVGIGLFVQVYGVLGVVMSFFACGRRLGKGLFFLRFFLVLVGLRGFGDVVSLWV